MSELESVRMSQMITGAWISQIIYVIAKLELADRIAEGPKTSDELASESDAHAQSMSRLLRASASIGVFRKDESDKYHLTPLAESLRSDVPGTQRALAIMMGEEHFRCWGELLHSVRTGENAFKYLYEKPIFEYLGEHPEQAKIFDAAMTSVHGRESGPMARAYNFSQFETIADIGGGNGSLLIEILREHPQCESDPLRPSECHRTDSSEHRARGDVGSNSAHRRELLRIDSGGCRCLSDATHHPRLERRTMQLDPGKYPSGAEVGREVFDR